MDDNTKDVLISLLEIGSISSFFWASAMAVRWQGLRLDEEEEEEEEDQGDDATASGIVRATTKDASAGDEDDDDPDDALAATCPTVGECPYRTELQLTYGLTTRPVAHLLKWFVIVGAGGLSVGFIAGMLVARVQNYTFAWYG